MTQFVDIIANGLADGCIYALIGLGLVLLQMTTGVINFAQGDLMSLGCALAFVLLVREGIGQVGTFVLVLVMMFLAGMVLERVGYLLEYRFVVVHIVPQGSVDAATIARFFRVSKQRDALRRCGPRHRRQAHVRARPCGR